MTTEPTTNENPRRTTKPTREIIDDDAPGTQRVLEGFDQKRVPVIERWAWKADATRETINGLKDELANQEFKLREAVHENADKVDHQQTEDGAELLVYKRGDYDVKVKRGKEVVNYKIGEKSKGDEPGSEGGVE